jgi:hypothetical protein
MFVITDHPVNRNLTSIAQVSARIRLLFRTITKKSVVTNSAGIHVFVQRLRSPDL